MRLLVNREAFKAAFDVASSVVNNSSPNEILKNIKVVVQDDNTAVVMGTNSETGSRVKVKAVESSPGSMLLNAKDVSSLINESSDENIELSLDGSSVILSGASFKFRFNSANPDEYPTVAESESNEFYSVPTSLFLAMLKRTTYACDPSSTRYALNGILFEFIEETIIVIGTDGRRLSTMTGNIKIVGEPYRPSSSTIIPSEAVRSIERFVAGTEKVCFAVNPSMAMIWHEGGSFFARLLEGRYPNWRTVMDVQKNTQHVGHKVTIPAGSLAVAVRQAAVVNDKETRGLVFDFTSDNLALRAAVKDKGDGVVNLPIKAEGLRCTTRLDYRYVREFVSAVDPAIPVTLHIWEPHLAIKFSTGDGYEGVIMPMALEA